MHKTILYSLVGIALAGAPVEAQEAAELPGPSISFEASAVSSYLWRGSVVNSSPSLQPSMTIAYRGLSVNLWSNVSRNALRNQAWTESDITLEYGKQVGKWLLAGGFVDYQFVDTPAGDGNRSAEVYLGCSFDGPLSPSIRVYRDIKLGRGSYYAASIAKGFRVPWGANAMTTLAIGVNQHQFQTQTTISNVESTTSIDVFSNDRLVVSPFLTVMHGHRSLFGTHLAFGFRTVIQR